jgi:hypothetical protein
MSERALGRGLPRRRSINRVEIPVFDSLRTKPNPLADLVLIARRDLGLHESPRGSNMGAELQKFFTADDLVIDGQTDGYPWCACGLSYWVQEFLKGHPEFSRTKPPRIARAYDFCEVWGPANGCIIFTPDQNLFTIRAGDIIVWKFSHASLAVSSNRSSATTYDCNSNDEGKRDGFEVCELTRSLSQVLAAVRMLPDAARA